MDKKWFSLGLLVMGLAIACMFMSCKSIDYAQPDFGSSHSYVIDMYSVSKDIEDNIRLINRTTKSDISFKVSLHDPKNFIWVEYGVADLKEPGDTAFISSKLSGKLDRYRYAAIEALDGNDYGYNFYETRSDLYINITDR
jgi:hypothetical protein